MLQPQQQPHPHPLQIIYTSNFHSKTGNIFQVTQDFLNFLDSQSSFTITGKLQDDLILSTQQKTYKLRGINLPTTMLIIDSKGQIQLELNNFIKLQDYSHQYHKIYSRIKQQAPQQSDWDQLQLPQLIHKFGLEDHQIKQAFKISLKQFSKFQEFLNFLYLDNKRLFISKLIMHKYMRSLLAFITQRQLYNQDFTLHDLKDFDPQIKAFAQLDERIFNMIIKMFCFEVNNVPQYQKMEIEGETRSEPSYRLTFESIVHFVVIELSTTSSQYKATQMDNLLTKMLNIYTPTGMEVPQEQQKRQLIRRVISRYFMQTTKNGNIIRIYYDPLEIQSSLKGRIKFMSGFKSRFSREQIRGVFEGMVIQQNSKEIKQNSIQNGRKSIDMDDLLLKNFRRFNELYEIKLILPK